MARMFPNILVKGGHYTLDQIVGRNEVEAAGGQVVSILIVPGYSTTAIIEAAQRAVGDKHWTAKGNSAFFSIGQFFRRSV